MKRSRINDILREGDDFIKSFGFRLPPFAYWSPDQMRERRSDISGILNARLGWDITDYGQGDFDKLGRSLWSGWMGEASPQPLYAPADVRELRGVA